jgi:hypothetical protein
MKKFVYASLMFMFPIVTFAQLNVGPAQTAVSSIGKLINTIIPLLIGAAVLVFLWGVLKYVLAGSEDPAKKTEARSFMIWGIIAIFVMVSVMGLIGLVQNVSGVSSTGNVSLPQVNIPQPVR